MLEKLYAKSRQVCKVTFELPKDIKAESVCLVGEFNDWNPTATPMKRNKKGAFRLTL
ncbi:MAG: isoamylase early set domain-containing protein, partial [Anaerolineales bacterium]